LIFYHFKLIYNGFFRATVFSQEVHVLHKYPKHTLLDVSGLKSDRALHKVWHIAAKLSHKTNLAMT